MRNFNAGMSLPLRQDDPDYPALVLANYMIGGDFNSRLTARVRQKEGISYGIGSSLGADVFDKSGTFTISAIAAPENIARVESAVKEELARALKDGFTADELKVAKQGWLQSREVTRTEDFSIASSLRAYLYQGRTFTVSGTPTSNARFKRSRPIRSSPR